MRSLHRGLNKRLMTKQLRHLVLSPAMGAHKGSPAPTSPFAAFCVGWSWVMMCMSVLGVHSALKEVALDFRWSLLSP